MSRHEVGKRLKSGTRPADYCHDGLGTGTPRKKALIEKAKLQESSIAEAVLVNLLLKALPTQNKASRTPD